MTNSIDTLIFNSFKFQIKNHWIYMQGVVSSGTAFAIQIWVIDKGGPVFFSLYLPLQTLLVAIMATLILGEEFYLGG